MILMYHKVDVVAPTIWWVTPADLARQLDEVAETRRFVFLDDYTDPRTQAVVTFDDAYENVARHAAPVLAKRGIPFEVFVIGSKVGDWNDADVTEPMTRHMGLADLHAVVRSGGRLQWHSSTHVPLKGLDLAKVEDELQVAPALAAMFAPPHFGWFSYPYGALDEAAVRVARAKFRGAVSVLDGDPSDRWQLHRITVDRFTRF